MDSQRWRWIMALETTWGVVGKLCPSYLAVADCHDVRSQLVLQVKIKRSLADVLPDSLRLDETLASF